MGNNGSTIFPVHVLGKAYEEKHIVELQRHAESFFRFTYRRGFPELVPSVLTSDGGWGCMLRSAQMLMGHTLTRHYLGTEWRMPPNVQASRVRKSRIQALSENEIYCEIVRWFTDYPGWPHVYSLHHLVHCGTYRYGKPAGQWVGPSTAAHMLRDLARLHCALFGGTLEVLVTQGDCIYRSEAELVATRTTESRAEYVHSLRQHHHNQLQKQKEQQQEEEQNQDDEEQQQQYRVNSVDVSSTTTSDAQRVFSGDWQNPVTALPKAPINPVVPLHPLLVPLSFAAGHSDSEVDGLLLNSSVENTPVDSSTSNAAASGAKAESTINEAAAGRNDLADVSNQNQRETEQQKNEFFDPLLRPPPKVQTPWTAALMVLVPLMLGISTVNREYIEEVKEVLRHKHCVGIIGGSPNHAIYFVGYRGDLLLGLDPHTVFANPPVPPPRKTANSSGMVAPLPPAVPLNPVSTGNSSVNRGVKREPTTRLSESSDHSNGSESRTHSISNTNSRGSSVDNSHLHPSTATATLRTHPTYPTHPTNTTNNNNNNNNNNRPGLGLNSSYNTTTTNDSFFNMFGATFASSTTPSPESFPSAEYLHQVHVSEFVTLDIHRLDPSLAIGFYFSNRAEFDAFCEETKLSVARKLREGKYPLYTVQDLAPTFMYSGEGEGEGEGEMEGEGEDRESFDSRSQDEAEVEIDQDDTTDYAQVNESCHMDVTNTDATQHHTVSSPLRADKKKVGTNTYNNNKRRSSAKRGSYRGRRSGGGVPDPVLPDDPDDEQYVLV